MPYERISTNLKRAMIAAEDAKFVDHEGFDWDGIQLALEKNQKKGRVVAGGSTITQQLAKNLFLTPSRSYLRKARGGGDHGDARDDAPDKRRILEIYLNVIEWGNGVFGAEAAARRYFGVSAPRSCRRSRRRGSPPWRPTPASTSAIQGAPGLNRKIGIIVARMPSAELP